MLFRFDQESHGNICLVLCISGPASMVFSRPVFSLGLVHKDVKSYLQSPFLGFTQMWLKCRGLVCKDMRGGKGSGWKSCSCRRIGFDTR